jgi:hypothetical protein
MTRKAGSFISLVTLYILHGIAFLKTVIFIITDLTVSTQSLQTFSTTVHILQSKENTRWSLGNTLPTSQPSKLQPSQRNTISSSYFAVHRTKVSSERERRIRNHREAKSNQSV